MLLDLFVTWLGMPVEAEPLVRVIRVEPVPPIPLLWIVRESGRSGGDSKHTGEDRAVWHASWLQLPCPPAPPHAIRDRRSGAKRRRLKGIPHGENWWR